MNSTLHRLRRWTVTAIAATTLLSTGIILASAGPAGALVDTGVITGLSQPPIVTSVVPVNNQPAGDLSLTIPNGTALHNNDLISVVVESNSGGTIRWGSVPTFATSSGTGPNTQLCIVGSPSPGTAPTCAATIGATPTPNITGGGDTLTFEIGNAAGGAAGAPFSDGGTITLSSVTLDVPAATTVGPDFNTATSPDINFEPGNTVSHNATGPGAPADNSTNAVIGNTAAAPTPTLRAVTTPAVAIGGSDQTAGSWNLFIAKPGGSGVTAISAGDKVNIVIADNAGNNCNPGTLADPDTIGFAATPSIDITAGNGSATAVPTATVATSAVTDGADVLCAGTSVQNMLTITFTNTVVLTSTATPLSGVEIQITGVKYNVSGGATIAGDQGTVDVGSNYDPSGFSALPSPLGFSHAPAGLTPGTSGPSNADVTDIIVTGNTPPSDIQLNVTSLAGSGSEAVDQPVSPITLAESFPGALPSGANGYVCVSLLAGGAWNGGSSPTASATNGATVGPVTILTTGPIAGDSTLEFQVTGGSTTGPTTITLSNLAVDVPQSLIDDILGGFVSVTYGGTNPVCSGGATTFTATKAFSVSGRIYGVDADATAAQAFAIANPVGGGGNVGAVLATSTDPYDALSASYLAGQTGTGILLTGTGSTVDPETMTELRLAGVETVYAVGGPNVISQGQITELESTPVYLPGGTTQVYDPSTNDVRLIEVQWIYGATADDTAAQVAQYVGDFPIGNPVVEAAYNGQYNDTAGSNGSPQSTAPDTGVQTAIIATDTGFQDAASASVMAYHNHLPLILSPANALSPGSVQALDNDGIQQALVMGGPDVINDSVVTQLEGMGISVLRIAGSDYTDTSAEAAKFELNSTDSAGQLDGLGYSLIRSLIPIPTALNLNLISLSFARGDFYTDAIVSSQINSFLESPELLTENPTTLGTPVATFLATEGNPTTAYGQSTATGPQGSSTNQYPVVAGQAIFGGPLAFNAAVETTIAQDLGPDQLPIP